MARRAEDLLLGMKVLGGRAEKQQVMIDRLLGEDREVLPDPGEAWAELARADIAALPPERQAAWKQYSRLSRSWKTSYRRRSTTNFPIRIVISITYLTPRVRLWLIMCCRIISDLAGRMLV